MLQREVVPARHRRGAALVVVLLTVAILTTVVIDFVYQTRVQLHMAVNQRDEVRAYYLAKSGLDLARLALGFQKQVNSFGGGVNIQIWQYLNQFMGAFNAAKVDLPVASVDLSAVSGLGGLTGGFEVEIEPQDGKININALGATNPTSRIETIARLTMLMSPPDNQDLFEQKDSSGQFNDIPEIISGIVDWIDVDQDLTSFTGDDYAATGPGQEANRYRSFGRKVQPRNAKIDTLQELHRIKGVSDEWFDRFGEALTVYPSTKINVNTANEQLLAVLICLNLANPQDDLCTNPARLPDVLSVVAAIRLWQDLRRNVLMMTPFQNVASFVEFVQGGGRGDLRQLGIEFRPPLLDFNKLRQIVEVRSPSIYQIKSEGHIGSTTKTLVAVIDINKDGRLYYWREF